MNKVIHFEIPAADMQEAVKFYEEVFGWKMHKAMDEYTIAITGPTDEQQMPAEPGFINGAIMKKEDDAPTPVLVVGVDDLNASLEKIKSHGGTVVMEPTKVFDMGIYARVKDPEGNIIGVWQDLKKE